MSAQAVAERIYQRNFASEAARQALIRKTAKSMASDLRRDLLTNERDLFDVADDIPGNITTDTMKRIVRALLAGRSESVFQALLIELDESIKRAAEMRAVKHVESMTAEDFLPD